jgi:excinuclease ABC subunit C
LDEIKGIGVTTRKQLLQEYKTVSRMRAASAEELERLIGKHKTRLLLKGFRDNPV